MGIAPANANIPWDKTINPLCPSCTLVPKTCLHILFCNHAGRVDVHMKSIDLMKQWLTEVDTDPELLDCIVEYAQGQGGITMAEICYKKAHLYQLMAADQDEIGWRRFMEGMICRRARAIQTVYSTIKGSSISHLQWSEGLVIKLLEATHGQWLYRCVQIHVKVTGTLVTAHMEEILQEIVRQLKLGMEDLLDEDQYLAEINLNDLESSLGEHQEYWLLAICAAREAGLLRGQQTSNNCRRTAVR
jgi:hypothetical protein